EPHHALRIDRHSRCCRHRRRHLCLPAIAAASARSQTRRQRPQDQRNGGRPMSDERKQLILEAINTELKTQGGKVNPLALASAIDAALGADTLEAGRRAATTDGPPGAGSSP